jgi:hypothetical protein
LFETEFARWLRYTSAAALTIGAGAMVFWYLSQASDNRVVFALASMAVLSLAYMWITRRWAWLYVCGVQVVCLLTIGGEYFYTAGMHRETNLPLATGLLCFIVGVAITAMKSGVHERWLPVESDQPRFARFQIGL